MANYCGVDPSACFGVRNGAGPTALQRCMIEAVAFLVMFVMCSLNFSLLSRVTPRN